MDGITFDEIADSDKNIAACVLHHGMKNICKVRRAVQACNGRLDINDLNALQIIAAIVGLIPEDLRSIYLTINFKAPVLLSSNLGDDNEVFQFLEPPTKTCLLNCESGSVASLQHHNQPVEGRLYDVSGTVITVYRITTRCRKCASIYHYDMYRSAITGKYYFYPHQQPLVRISSQTYWTRNLYNLFINNMLQCHATFRGFSETYNEAFGRKGLSRKHVSEAFRRQETEQELRRLKLDYGFSNQFDLDEILPLFDRTRCDNLYPHKHNQRCVSQGCGVLWSTDAIWSINFPICAMNQENKVENIHLVNYPDVCTNEPLRKRGALFCEHHTGKVKELGFPTHKKHYEYHLQGVGLLLSSFRSRNVALPKGDDVHVFDDGVPCQKNTGQPKNQPVRSRGYLAVVRAGGHIDLLAPIYKSESPSQVYLILLGWMYQILKQEDPSRWPNLFLAYDNMCHLDRLNGAQLDLPLPKPFDKMWSAGMTKVIDRFHLGNHVGHACKTVYNPQRISDTYPNLKTTNTQSCEQTFSYLGGFRHALFKMSKYRQLLAMHVIALKRNAYLAKDIHLDSDSDDDNLNENTVES